MIEIPLPMHIQLWIESGKMITTMMKIMMMTMMMKIMMIIMMMNVMMMMTMMMTIVITMMIQEPVSVHLLLGLKCKPGRLKSGEFTVKDFDDFVFFIFFALLSLSSSCYRHLVIFILLS